MKLNGTETLFLWTIVDQLEEITVESADESIATATYDELDHLITVTGISVGVTTLTVYAKDAIPATINVTVAKSFISVNKSNINLQIDNEKSVQILNPNELEDIVVESLDETIATVVYDESQNVFIVKGISSGVTQIRITAKDAPTVEIKVIIS